MLTHLPSTHLHRGLVNNTDTTSYPSNTTNHIFPAKINCRTRQVYETATSGYEGIHQCNVYSAFIVIMMLQIPFPHTTILKCHQGLKYPLQWSPALFVPWHCYLR
jgi:hypothetical protein